MKKKYIVEFRRSIVEQADVTVEASSEEEAEELANKKLDKQPSLWTSSFEHEEVLEIVLDEDGEPESA